MHWLDSLKRRNYLFLLTVQAATICYRTFTLTIRQQSNNCIVLRRTASFEGVCYIVKVRLQNYYWQDLPLVHTSDAFDNCLDLRQKLFVKCFPKEARSSSNLFSTSTTQVLQTLLFLYWMSNTWTTRVRSFTPKNEYYLQWLCSCVWRLLHGCVTCIFL